MPFGKPYARGLLRERGRGGGEGGSVDPPGDEVRRELDRVGLPCTGQAAGARVGAMAARDARPSPSDPGASVRVPPGTLHPEPRALEAPVCLVLPILPGRRGWLGEWWVVAAGWHAPGGRGSAADRGWGVGGGRGTGFGGGLNGHWLPWPAEPGGGPVLSLGARGAVGSLAGLTSLPAVARVGRSGRASPPRQPAGDPECPASPPRLIPSSLSSARKKKKKQKNKRPTTLSVKGSQCRFGPASSCWN
ncbi:unnamed protein product [Rangifer tarandus platyrhynchus]|uniref:Uncharacterized protein n=2 Tax=Rangifer tarandus platyrhynchus TaxID=3082113 RepID=A0ACB0ETR0_RANTA|nr:unnamed protein product [Rangifer tarandus platyrhynchus]CAI9703939.1 unnamed protein product [Rangifer tarandus platyrhynchus]